MQLLDRHRGYCGYTPNSLEHPLSSTCSLSPEYCCLLCNVAVHICSSRTAAMGIKCNCQCYLQKRICDFLTVLTSIFRQVLDSSDLGSHDARTFLNEDILHQLTVSGIEVRGLRGQPLGLIGQSDVMREVVNVYAPIRAAATLRTD